MQEVGREHEHRSMIFLKGKHGILGGLVLFEVNGVDKIPDQSSSQSQRPIVFQCKFLL